MALALLPDPALDPDPDPDPVPELDPEPDLDLTLDPDPDTDPELDPDPDRDLDPALDPDPDPDPPLPGAPLVFAALPALLLPPADAAAEALWSRPSPPEPVRVRFAVAGASDSSASAPASSLRGRPRLAPLAPSTVLANLPPALRGGESPLPASLALSALAAPAASFAANSAAFFSET
jgi:hypothetical protein